MDLEALTAYRLIFTRHDADLMGVSADQLAWWLRKGLIHRVARSSYINATAWHEATQPERYAFKVRAVARARGAVASFHSAAVLHELPLYQVDTSIVEIQDLVSRTRIHDGVRVRATTSFDSVGWMHNVRLVSAAQACVQVASESLVSGVVMLDQALARGMCTKADVRRFGQGLYKGSSSIRTLLKVADPLSLSPCHSVLRLLLHNLGYAPVSQAPIRAHGQLVTTADLLVGPVVVHVDDSWDGQWAASPSPVVARQFNATAATLRELGYGVVRLTWADVDSPERVRALIEAQRRRASLFTIRRHAEPALQPERPVQRC